MAAQAWTGLGDAITAIRCELSQAMAAGEDSDLKFRAGPIELEFATTIHTDAEGRVKVLLLPWRAEAKVDRASDRVHRLKFTLQPVGSATGEDKLISGDSAERPR